MGVPQEKVTVLIPTKNLLELPEGATFTNRNGRANVTVKTNRDTIHINAACDSLQTLVEYYENKISQTQSNASVYKTESIKDVSTGVSAPFKQVSIGFMAGILLTIIILIITRK